MADEIKTNNDFMARLLANVDPEARENMLSRGSSKSVSAGRAAPTDTAGEAENPSEAPGAKSGQAAWTAMPTLKKPTSAEWNTVPTLKKPVQAEWNAVPTQKQPLKAAVKTGEDQNAAAASARKPAAPGAKKSSSAARAKTGASSMERRPAQADAGVSSMEKRPAQADAGVSSMEKRPSQAGKKAARMEPMAAHEEPITETGEWVPDTDELEAAAADWEAAPADKKTPAAGKKPARAGKAALLLDKAKTLLTRKSPSAAKKKGTPAADEATVPADTAAYEDLPETTDDNLETDPDLLAELVSDMAFENEDRYKIPLRRGHDKSLRFWFDPMSKKIWEGHADLIYRDELSVDNHAAHQLLLPFIEERFEGKFFFRNELNLLPMENAKLLKEDFRQAAVALKRGDLKNPILEGVLENLTIDILVPEEEYNEKYLSAGPFEKRRAIRENLPVAADFYMSVADYLDEMLRRYIPKGFTSIAISAPV